MLKVKDIDQTQQPLLDHLIELRKRNRQLEMEVDVLKQAALIFARK